MKKTITFWITGILALSLQSQGSFAQSIDEERMKRDIQVAESALATLIKREMNNQNTLFGLDVKGAYQPGYGVTFRLPGDHSMPFVVRIAGDALRRATVVSDGNGYQYSFHTNGSEEETAAGDQSVKLKEKTEISGDSIRNAYHENMIKAAQNFILDYGDLLSQLPPREKIVVTNQSDRPHLFSSGKRTRISVEGTLQDITALRQGKISRDQAMKKLTIVNT